MGFSRGNCNLLFEVLWFFWWEIELCGRVDRCNSRYLDEVHLVDPSHLANSNWTSFICKVIFPAVFFFVFWKRKFWREKIYFAKKAFPFKFDTIRDMATPERIVKANPQTCTSRKCNQWYKLNFLISKINFL
jgi:hypothetical protein